MLHGTIENTMGAGFLGSIGACILFGVSIVQAWMYYTNFPNDWTSQKISVAVLMALDTLHLSITIHAMYYYMINQFGNVLALQTVVWSFKLQTTLSVVIVFIVQCLYTVRVWKLGRYRSRGLFVKLIPAFISILLVSAVIVGFILSYKVFRIFHFDSVRQSGVKWAVTASLAMSTGNDVIIAAALCYYLQDSRTGFSSTNNRLVVIMHYVLISGAFTAACSMSAVVTFLSMPNNLIFLGILFLLSKLYVNSYLAMLNARRTGRRETDSSPVSVTKLMNMKRRQAKTIDSPTSQSERDEESLALPTIGYTGKERSDNMDPNLTVKTADLSTSFGGVTIHRIEERKYDDDKNWTPV